MVYTGAPILAGGLLGFVLHSSFLLYQKKEQILKFTATAIPLALVFLAAFWMLVFPNLYSWSIYINTPVLIVASVLGAVLLGSILSMAVLKVLWRS